jgi:hypothetical protein
MRTYMTIYIPELDILDTISKEIISIDIDNPFKIHNRTEDYYKVEPYIYISGCLASAISKKQLNNLNYECQIINDTEYISNLLENDFKIMSAFLDKIAAVVTYTGDCEKYQGEEIAIKKMIEYAENLKGICKNKLESL